MPLFPGTCLGAYEILASLGAGGMGEVYRAKDTKLEREVAIKILPDAVANDPERLARFEREAKVLASLNHPNIAQIYGIEERALVMELVEGETLRGPLPVEVALQLARQISEALEARPIQAALAALEALDDKLAAEGEEIGRLEKAGVVEINADPTGQLKAATLGWGPNSPNEMVLSPITPQS